jgi:hypothetical protein
MPGAGPAGNETSELARRTRDAGRTSLRSIFHGPPWSRR